MAHFNLACPETCISIGYNGDYESLTVPSNRSLLLVYISTIFSNQIKVFIAVSVLQPDPGLSLETRLTMCVSGNSTL
jgi:hypothetical protein